MPGTDYQDGKDLSYALNSEQAASSFGVANTYRKLANDAMLASMRASKIMIYGGHSTPTYVYSYSVSSLDLNVTDINSLSGTPLSDNELILFISCEAGSGGATANNLATATYAKGAQVVVAFTTTVGEAESLLWGRYFLESLLEGNSINAAMYDADEFIEKSEYQDNPGTSAENRLVLGDASGCPFADS